MGVIDVIENYIPIFLDKEGKLLLRNTWDKSQRNKVELNAKTRYTLLSTLSKDKVNEVITMFIAKKIWSVIALSHDEFHENSHN